MSAAQRTVDKMTPLVAMPNIASVLIPFARKMGSRSVVENAPTRRLVTTMPALLGSNAHMNLRAGSALAQTARLFEHGEALVLAAHLWIAIAEANDHVNDGQVRVACGLDDLAGLFQQRSARGFRHHARGRWDTSHTLPVILAGYWGHAR